MNRASDFFNDLFNTAKSCIKILLSSRPTSVIPAKPNPLDTLYILANGPSLRKLLDENIEFLQRQTTLAVNFAANAPEFKTLKPNYYVLADPHFFRATTDPLVKELLKNLFSTDWPMTIFVVSKFYNDFKHSFSANKHITIASFNAVGVEGFAFFEKMVYKRGMGMPRPRNVLIPSIMTGLRLGYKNIVLCGADHSWMQDLNVDANNNVRLGLTHFYKENESETKRSASEYEHHYLHDIVMSYYVAFRAYHRIRKFADSIHASVINATKGSYIDAFERKEFQAFVSESSCNS